MFANVCILEHLPRISRESYVVSESMLVSMQCIEAVVTDVQPRAQHIFKYHDGDIWELTGDVIAYWAHYKRVSTCVNITSFKEYATLFLPHPLKAK